MKGKKNAKNDGECCNIETSKARKAADELKLGPKLPWGISEGTRARDPDAVAIRVRYGRRGRCRARRGGFLVGGGEGEGEVQTSASAARRTRGGQAPLRTPRLDLLYPRVGTGGLLGLDL